MKFLHTYYSPAMTREYIEGWLACGPPAAVVAKIRAYVEAGCTTPILRFASWDQKGQLARALAEVMPAALAAGERREGRAGIMTARPRAHDEPAMSPDASCSPG